MTDITPLGPIAPVRTGASGATVPDPLTGEQLASIRARCDAATSGTWYLQPHYGPDFVASELAGYEHGIGTLNFGEGDQADADREFVLNAHTDIAALLAEIDRLRAVRAELGRVRAELGTAKAALAKACTCWSNDQFMHLPDCHGNHIMWNNQTWHAAAAYTDREQGVWWLVAVGRSGEPEFRPDTGDEDYTAPLSEVLAEFGPLIPTPQVEIPQPS